MFKRTEIGRKDRSSLVKEPEGQIVELMPPPFNKYTKISLAVAGGFKSRYTHMLEDPSEAS